MTDINNIPPYIFVKSIVDWYYYLHIHGGVGHGDETLGGTHRFVLTYLTPEQSAEAGQMSLEKYCKDNNIPYGGGDTIDEASKEFAEAYALNPIK